jgi:predicted phage terminase large subunit-like protein
MVELSELILAMSPAELEAFGSQLPPEDAELLGRVMAEHHAAGWRADPARMAHHLDPSFIVKTYVAYLSERLVELADMTGRRLIINMPARLGKTTLLRWFLVWLLDRHPTSQSIFTSYGDQLAVESALAVRDILRMHAGQLRAQLMRDRQQRDRWMTTDGGGLLAAGLNATITGYGVSAHGVLLVDDPFKNWAEAHSASRRLAVFEQFRGTLRNRLDDERCGIGVVHHRMHQDDLTGMLKAAAEDETGEQWDIVALPQLAVAGDILGRAPGEPLDPERFPPEAVQQRWLALGSYLASALEQQAPSAEEGTDIKRAWFHIVDAGELPAAYEQSLTSWDLKLKNREAGDYVVGQVWGRTGPDYWLRDQVRGQFDHATTGNAIALLAVRHPDVRTHVVEAAGSHDEVLPQLRKAIPEYVVTDEMAGRLGMTPIERELVQALRRRGMSGLIAHPVTEGSKPVRARTFIVPAAEAGNVHVVNASWTPSYLDEQSGFPGGANDDQVDATSQALQRLGVGAASMTAPTRRAAPPATAHQPAAPTVRRSSGLIAPTRRRR